MKQYKAGTPTSVGSLCQPVEVASDTRSKKRRNDNVKGFTNMSVIIRQGSTYKVADESDIEVTKKTSSKNICGKIP